MQYQGQVIDKGSGEALASVTITIDGTPVGVSDSSGNFNIVTQVQGSEMTFSYVGYDPINVPLSQVNDLYQIGMTPNDSAEILPAVVVTPQGVTAAAAAPVIGKKDYTPYLIAGAAGLVLLGSTKHPKKRVGAMSSGTMLALAAGGGLLLYLLLKQRAPAPVQPVAQVYSPAYLQAVATQSNPVAQDISAGATGVSAVSNLVSAISNL